MDKITLTEEQQLKILEEWNNRPDDPPSLLELIKVAFPGQNVDGRSKEGKVVKSFLATRKIEARRAHDYQHKDKIELNEDHQEFIINNASTMSANEMARVLFKNPDLMPLSQETRTINDFIKTLDAKVIYQDVEDLPEENYKPPKTFFTMVNRINKYVHEGLNKDKMTPKQKKDVESLIGYMHTYRFLHHINNYTSQTDRELFESSFVRYANDKYDLTQEEVDQYIVLSIEVVIAANIQRRVERLQILMDNAADDTDGRRIAMSLVEAISTNQTEYNQCVNRQHKLLGDLKEKRSDKLKSQIKDNASILNLVSAWREEETRSQLIGLAEKRKAIVREEIEKLSNMDEVKCRILGLGEDEALNG